MDNVQRCTSKELGARKERRRIFDVDAENGRETELSIPRESGGRDAAFEYRLEKRSEPWDRI